MYRVLLFFFQAEDGIRDIGVTGVQTCALPISYRAINNAYPNKFKPWELKRTPAKFWNKETSYEFIRWFIEEKNNWTDEEIKNNFSKTLLINMGFDAPMDRMKEDTFEIINKLYPNKFKRSEERRVGKE